jgi:hypothetical protein
MAQELEVRKGATDPRAKLTARVAKDFAEADKGRKAALELTQVPVDLGPHAWQIFAFGPYQTPDAQPGRIIKKGEKAYIAIVVWMNAAMCQVITQHGDKIELNIYTMDTEKVKAVEALEHYCCIATVPGHCWYVYVWELEPEDAACIYETNICARICTCSDVVLEDYAGFVRHVYDFDPETLWPPIPPILLPPHPDVPDQPTLPTDPNWPPVPTVPPPPGWGFDRPIRYMVYNPETVCECGDPDVEPNNFCKYVISSP